MWTTRSFRLNISERAPLVAMLSVAWLLGVQMAIGYGAVPVMFAGLPPARAGELAGLVLTGSEISAVLVLGLVMLMPQPLSSRLLLAVALSAQLLQLVWLNPEMNELKASGLTDAATHARFMRLHGLSQGVYLAAQLMMLFWLVRMVGRNK